MTTSARRFPIVLLVLAACGTGTGPSTHITSDIDTFVPGPDASEGIEDPGTGDAEEARLEVPAEAVPGDLPADPGDDPAADAEPDAPAPDGEAGDLPPVDPGTVDTPVTDPGTTDLPPADEAPADVAPVDVPPADASGCADDGPCKGYSCVAGACATTCDPPALPCALGYQCTGAGTCAAIVQCKTDADCAGYRCDNGVCTHSCGPGAGCTEGWECRDGACVALVPCQNDGPCAGYACDGGWCATACDPPGLPCALGFQCAGGGTCVPIVPCKLDTDCGGYLCDNGICTTGCGGFGEAGCATGYDCIDGACVPGTPCTDDAPCAGYACVDGWCSRSCDPFPGGQACGAGYACDLLTGGCVLVVACTTSEDPACGGYLCNTFEGTCLSACAGGLAGCATGFECTGGACIPLAPCTDDAACTPFACAGGYCRTDCNTTAEDCAEGAICDTWSHACEATRTCDAQGQCDGYRCSTTQGLCYTWCSTGGGPGSGPSCDAGYQCVSHRCQPD